MTEPNGFLAAALALAERGWAVMPLRPGRKEPSTEHGCHDATRDPAAIEAWWRRWPRGNVGVATGEPSGIVVVDVDGPEGRASWAKLELDHGGVETLTQETGRADGGRQLVFRHPGQRVPCRTGWLPGLDCRGDGGYVVVPPSIHPSGKRYRWLARGEPAPLPGWLLELLVARRPTPTSSAAPPPRPTGPGSTTPWGKKRLEAQVAIVAGAAPGCRNATLNTAAFKVGQAVSSGEIDEEEARAELYAAALACGLEDRETRRTIESGLKRGQDEPRAPREREPRGRRPAAPPRDDAPPPPEPDDLVEDDGPDVDVDDWRGALMMGKGARIRPVLPNAVVLLRHHPAWAGRLVWDLRYLRAEWAAGPPWASDSAPRPLLESDAVEASRWLAAAEDVAFGADTLWTAMVAEAQRASVDRVRAYLDGLVWDERPRIDSWLVDLLQVEPGDERAEDWPAYIKAVGSSWLVSAVARAYRPGCQADHMLVLEGPQGTLKSSSLAALGGPHYAELALDVESRDSLMQIHGPWIVEWSELAGLSRREAESVKAFISRRSDRFRPPYGRHVDDYPRSCVFAGTTNEALSLSDSTGNRRYWPVHVGRARPEEIEAARDQLWAEAVFRYHCGEHWWLDQDLERVARAQQEARLDRDAWEETIADALDNGALARRDFVTAGDVYAALQIGAVQQTTGAGRRIARVMDRLGWRSGRDRLEGRQTRGYFRPGRLIEMSRMEAP